METINVTINDEKLTSNSEILFLYDAKACNPNGDPDNENKPRMDLLKERLLVSDVRLKRYIRDYFMNVKKLPIFVSKVDNKTVDATDRFAYFIAELILKDEKKYESIMKDFKDNNKNIETVKAYIRKANKWPDININDFLKYFIDMRLFGVTLPIKDEQRGTSITFTGPVQFNWGYSLNKAELIESPSITSYFAGRTKGEVQEGGAIWKDWRVYYSLIAFYGRVSSVLAEKTNLTQQDVKDLDEAIWQSIITETNTRTKFNQHPRLYIRIEYRDNQTFLGDLRRYVEIDKKECLRDIGEYNVDLSELKRKIDKNKEKISKIIIKVDDDIRDKISAIGEIENLLSHFNDK